MASIGTPTVTGESTYRVTCSGLEPGKQYSLLGMRAVDSSRFDFQSLFFF